MALATFNNARGDRLPGWAYRIRTAESGRGLPDWICVTTWPEVGASPAAETFAFELHDTHLQLGPIFQRGFKRDADRIVTIDLDQARGLFCTAILCVIALGLFLTVKR